MNGHLFAEPSPWGHMRILAACTPGLHSLARGWVYILRRLAGNSLLMCRVSDMTPAPYFPFDDTAADFAVAVQAPFIALDRIFEANVRKYAGAQEVEYHANLIEEIQSEMNMHVVALQDDTRSNFDVEANAFWASVTARGNVVSHYYQRGLSGQGGYMLEPCTGVVGARVILCFELYFNRSNRIVFRDLATSIYATLGEAIADFNAAQGLAPGVSYTFLTHTEAQGWESIALSTSILSMRLDRVLRLPVVQASNNVDFWRLSPCGVEEGECRGVLR